MPPRKSQESDRENRSAERLLEDRLRNAKLTPAQRQVARFIFDNPDRFVFMSAAEVARDVGVSQPSVTRLAQELGYRGYTELIGEVRGRARAMPEGGSATANRYQTALDDEIAHLMTVRDRLDDPRPLEKAAKKITAASCVVVAGLRISAPLAENFGYRLSRLRDNVRMITQGGSVAYDELALGARRKPPVLVVFAMPRYPAELIDILRFAKARGYWVLEFIDSPTAELCEHADQVMHAPLTWGLTFGSHTSTTVLSTFLIDAVASESSGDARARLIDLDGVASHEGHYL